MADFVTILALETSCEASARIMQSMNVKISGDTVTRMLLKRYHAQSSISCGSHIGVDDFAFKKRHTYGTVIVDEDSHMAVTVLEGRDGSALRTWLSRNKQVTTVTRDHASAYAKAVEEILPNCMQIADRFHLYQNLLEAVRNVVNSTVPVDIKISTDYTPSHTEAIPLGTPVENGKKMAETVDNSVEYNSKSIQLYYGIREYAVAGYSKREIAKIIHCGRNTVTKYLNGGHESLCRRDFKSGMDQFYDYIVKELTAGVSRKDVYRHLLLKGYKGK